MARKFFVGGNFKMCVNSLPRAEGSFPQHFYPAITIIISAPRHMSTQTPRE